MQTIILDAVIFGLQKAGGISRFWADLIVGLDKHFAKNHQVIVLVPKNKNIEWLKVQPQLCHVVVKKRRRFYPSKRSFFRGRGYLTALALKYRPTLWHSSYYVGFPYLFSGRKVQSFYDMIPEMYNVACPKESQAKKKSLEQSDSIVSISESSKQDLATMWPHLAHKINVIPLSTQIEPIQKPPKPYLLFIGKRRGYKNFNQAARAILNSPLFSHLNLVVVGGERELDHEELKLAKTYPKRLSFKGPLEPIQVATHLSEATALLYPSSYEGFGLPVLEAFTASVPVLACNTSSIPEITGEAYPLATPNDPSSFIATLARLLKERDQWIAYGEKRALAFTFSTMIKKFTNFYEI